MLSVSPINNPSYYSDLSSDDYYEKGGEPPGVWLGSGSARLGLSGKLTEGQLLRMMQGYHPKSGDALATNAGPDHRPGWDLTFSAPKSVSATWAAADEQTRQAISEAQRQAVRRAIQYLEQHVVEVRRGAGGVDREPARLICAAYEHSTSRALDPQLHTHLLVASHAIGAWSGDVRSIESKDIFVAQKSAGAVYRAELAQQMRQLGFAVEQDGQSFKVSGVPDDLLKEWSKRRAQVESRMAEKGGRSARAAEVAALDSREVKGVVDRAELFQRWQQEAAEHGFSPDQIRQPDMVAEAQPLDIQAIAAQLTEQKAVFNRSALHAAVAQAMQVSGGSFDERLAEVLESPEIVKLGVDSNGQPQYTTKAMLELEKQVVSWAERATNYSPSFKVSERAIAQAIEAHAGISDEQQAALRHVCQSNRIACIEGAAGVGKSYSMSAARQAWEASGLKVHGCALAGKAAAELQAGSGIQSQTIHSLLNDIDKERFRLDSRTVLVVDEAGMVDSKLMARLVEQVEASGAKLVLVGDTQQLQSVSAGGLFGAIKSKIGSAEILEVRRQKVDWQREVANDLRAGHAGAALASLHDHGALHIVDRTQDAHQRMVRAWLDCDSPAAEKLMIAGRRADVRSLNMLAREALIEQGAIRNSRRMEFCNEEGAERSIELGDGERVRFTRNDRLLGVKNGELASVTHISDSGKITCVTDSGRVVQFRLDQYHHVTHGYAVTAHASQGVTVDHAFYYSSGFSSKEMAYVAASRQRHGLHVYASREEIGDAAMQKMARLWSRSEEKRAAIEVQERLAAAEQAAIEAEQAQQQAAVEQQPARTLEIEIDFD